MSQAKPDGESRVEPRVEYRGTGIKGSLALILVTAVLLLIVAVQNASTVTVEFLVWEFDLPLFAVILGALLVGVVLDELVGLVVRRQRRSRLAEQAELKRLRSDREEQTRPQQAEESTESAAPRYDTDPEARDR